MTFLRGRLLSAFQNFAPKRLQSNGVQRMMRKWYGLGTLETGNLADVVAVPGDPVENIRQTELVFSEMKESVIYKNARAAAAH